MYECPPPSVTRRLLDLLVPSHCLTCRHRTAAPGRDLGLCPRCWGRLRPAPRRRCATCGVPFESGADLPRGARCGACRRHKPAIDALEFEWLYAAPLDTVVAALKFRRLRFLAPQLGHRLAGSIGGRLREALADGGPNTQEPLVTWVPLHWRRRALRSFDQAEGIARALAAGLCLPVIPTLTRRRATAPQSRSGARGRGMGVRGAFRPRSLGAVRGRSILLVDDVVTTGATLEAAARSLRRAGASRIVAAVVARTPGPSESP